MNITNADTGASGRVRIKTPRHPYESLEHLYARVLAYTHAWQNGLSFSHGLFNPDEPCMWKKDELNNILHWIDTGCPAKKKLLKALRSPSPYPPGTQYSVYFYNPSQISEFCDELRGSKSNWISNIQFYSLNPQTIEALIPLEKSSSRWDVTIIDNSLFMLCDGIEIHTEIKPLSMWDEYQLSIASDTNP